MEWSDHKIFHNCDLCTAKFFNNTQLQFHLKEIHSIEQTKLNRYERKIRGWKYNCSMCKFACNYEYVMKSHVPFKHKICPECSIQVVGDSNAMIHHVWKEHNQRYVFSL